MKRNLLLLSLFFIVSGCVWGTASPPKTQLEIREFQTRDFDTKDAKLVIKALLNTLQDDGYTIKNADANLGFLSATKEIDLGGSPGYIWTWGNNNPKEEARWRKLKVIDATANVTEFGNKTRVRVSFQEKILDNLGAVMEAHQIDDAKFYQDFFVKVDKGIFLQKEKL
ncbi:MAG: hypothetical protein WC956_00385 [bacterium]